MRNSEKNHAYPRFSSFSAPQSPTTWYLNKANKTLLAKRGTYLAEILEDAICAATEIPVELRSLCRRGGLRLWLLNFVDVVLAEWIGIAEDSRRLTTLAEKPKPTGSESCLSEKLSQSFLDVSQDVAWRSLIRELVIDHMSSNGGDHQKYLLGYETEADTINYPVLSSTTSQYCRRPQWILVDSYLRRFPLLLLLLSLRVKPKQIDLCISPANSHQIAHLRELDLKLGDNIPGSPLRFLSKHVLKFIPSEFFQLQPLEHKKFRSNKAKCTIVFTANRHLASNYFLLQVCQLRETQNIQVILSQHGGLYGQGAIPTRGAEFEQWFADTYFHWGWCSAPNAVKVPAQITMWKRKRRKSNNHKQLVLVTDCTFRYSRRPWPCDEENRRYRSMLLSSHGSIPMRLVGNVIVRLHHDHDKYDDSHSDMWRDAYPTVQLDDGLGPIDKLRKRARLMVSMSLGTSEIEQFARNIPTILRIDPVVHALRESCVELFSDMEKVGLVHWSDESFSAFLDENWDDIDAWWTSTSVREVVARYLDQFGYQSKKPLREFRAALKAAAAV